MISEGSPQDLLRRICTPGSPQDLRVRSCARSCKDLFCESDLRSDILCGNLQAECPATKVSRMFCASLHSRHGHGHVTRAILRENSQGISRKRPRPRTTTTVLCEPAQSKCTWTSQKSPFMREVTRKMSRPGLRASAVEMHLDISKEPFYARIYREITAPQDLAKPTAQTLCGPAQSKCTWTCH